MCFKSLYEHIEFCGRLY
nr:unnamed protein product [Callosobruchus analis]